MKKIIFTFLIINLLISGVTAIDVKRFYEQGVEAFNTGNYGSSELLFRKVIDNDGDSEVVDKAWFYLARTYYQQKKYQKAIYEFKSFLNKCNTTELCNESRYWIGEAYFNQKEYINAIEEYKRYITKNKKGNLVSNAHDRIGMIYYNQQRYDEAIIEWQKALSKSQQKQTNAQRIFRIGEALFQNGNYERSLKRLTPLLTSNSTVTILSRARLIIGKIYQKQGNDRKALNMFNRIPVNLLKDKPFTDAYYFKAKSYIKLRAYRSATNYLEKYLLAGKETTLYYEANYELGVLLINGKNINKGLNLLENIRKNSNNKSLQLKASEQLSYYYLKKDPQKAVQYLEDLLYITDEAKLKEITINLSKLYIKLKKFNKAEQLLANYQQKYPSYDDKIDEVLFFQAIIHLNKKDFNTAFSLFEKIQKSYPFSKYNNETKYFLGYVNYKKNNINKAIDLLRSYLTNKNTEYSYEANTLLLDCYLLKKNYKKAKIVLTTLRKRYTTYPGIEYALLKYIKATDDTRYNNTFYQNLLIKKYPNSEAAVELYKLLADKQFQKKQYKSALYYYTILQKIESNANDGNIFYKKILCLFYLQKYNVLTDTVKDTRIPPLDDDKWATLTILLAKSYYALKDYEKVYNTLLVNDMSVYSPDNLSMFLISSIHINDIQTALKWSKLIRKNKSKYSEFLLILAEYYKSKDDITNAQKYYRMVIDNNESLKFVDAAKINLAYIHIAKKNYQDALNIAKDISSKSLTAERDAIMIICYFKLNKYTQAVTLTKKNLRIYSRAAYGEQVIKENLVYNFENNNIKEFNRFAIILKYFKGNALYINYLSARLYYNNTAYKKSFYYFYKLSNTKNQYSEESLFYLGQISLYRNKNKRAAVRYFKKVINENETGQYQNKARINLAILLFEMNKKKESRQYLKEVIDTSAREDIRSKALNLYEIYGF